MDRTPPLVSISPPPDLLTREDRPVITPEAATSEQAYEDWRDDVDDWGMDNASIIDTACWWLQDAKVKLDCRPRPD